MGLGDTLTSELVDISSPSKSGQALFYSCYQAFSKQKILINSQKPSKKLLEKRPTPEFFNSFPVITSQQQGSVYITSPINGTDISAKWKSFKIAHTSAFFHYPPKCVIHPPLKLTHSRISSQKALSRRFWGKKNVFWWDIGTPSLLGGSSQGCVVNNHGDRCCPRRIRLSDPGPLHGHSWLINGGYQALPHWDDPPSRSIGTIGMVYLTYMKGCFFYGKNKG